MKFISSILFIYTTVAIADMPKWSYDAGPDLNSKMGRELIDLTANIPDMPSVSKKIIGKKQKFRPAFGPIPWRMRQDKNAVKILFMGQDGTHIAEAAGRPATAGFGGRAQDFANYFGVNEGAAFINAYSFTIKGQYGIYNTPYIYSKEGKSSVRVANYVSNELWAISNNLESPIVKWRNNLIDWIIRNNKDSMKLIVLFGGAARDAAATYARSKGASVGAHIDRDANRIQVPITKSEYAGGNNTFPSLVGKDGKDLYAKMLGKKIDYKDLKTQKEVVKHLKDNLNDYLKEMVFTKGGPSRNGMMNNAQLGGFNLNKMKINGISTRSLKGIKLNDGTVLENDIIVISLPHPSSLSRTVMEAGSYAEGLAAASSRVMRDVKVLDRYSSRGWMIEADPGKVNYYARGDNYVYKRADIGPEFYDFGTPANRMVSKSTARRMSGAANVVIIGTRDNGKFSKSEIKSMTNAKPAMGINPNQLFLARPSVVEQRYVFDSGPGEDLAKTMITNLDLKSIFKPKSEVTCEDGNGNIVKSVEVSIESNIEKVKCLTRHFKLVRKMSFDKDGINAFNVKTHPSVSDFGHYRGKLSNAEVLIIADPHGYDSIVTARALTGARGQFFQTAMNNIGVNDNYAVIKTVPFGMDGANSKEWKAVFDKTKTYRKELVSAILKKGKTKIIFADGKYAAKAVSEIIKDNSIKVVEVKRGTLASSGIKSAIKVVSPLTHYSPKMSNISRSHLSFYSRVWEGTSGDRVITSAGQKYKGLAFAVVVPQWAYKHELNMVSDDLKSVEKLKKVLFDFNLVLPYETIPRYIRRMDNSKSSFESLFDDAA